MGHTQTAGGRDVRAKHRLTQTGGASNLGTDVVYNLPADSSRSNKPAGFCVSKERRGEASDGQAPRV